MSDDRQQIDASFRNLLPEQGQKTPTLEDYRSALETAVEIIRLGAHLRSPANASMIDSQQDLQAWKSLDLLSAGFLTTIDDQKSGFNLPTDSEEDDNL